MSAEDFDVVFCKQRDENLAARVDAAADTIIKSHESGSPKRDRLITLVTNLHHAARVFGVDTGAWRGCLYELDREAWGADITTYDWRKRRLGAVAVYADGDRGRTFEARTLAEALVDSLEAVA